MLFCILYGGGLAKWKNKLTIGVGKIVRKAMSNTAEVELDDSLSRSQYLNRQKRADMPTTGLRLDPIKHSIAPKMTGESDELKLVPYEQRAASDSTKLEVVVIGILWGCR